MENWVDIKIPKTKNQAHSCHTSFLLQDNLFIFGGETHNEYNIVNSLFKFDKSTNSLLLHLPEFKNPFDLPEKRRNHATCTIKNKFYLFGGDAYRELNDFWEFDIETNKFTALKQNGDVPSTRRYHCLTSYNDKIYCFGGESEYDMLNDLFCYDLNNNTWKKVISNDSPSPRRYSSLVTIDKSLYLFGGRDENERMNDLWEFNVETNKWKEIISYKGKPPTPRAAHTGVSYKNTYYIFGGNSFDKEQNDLYEFNVQNFTWKKIVTTGDIIPPRFWHSACVNSKGELYVSGGFLKDSNLRDLWKIQLYPTLSTLSEQVYKSKNHFVDVIIKYSSKE